MVGINNNYFTLMEKKNYLINSGTFTSDIDSVSLMNAGLDFVLSMNNYHIDPLIIKNIEKNEIAIVSQEDIIADEIGEMFSEFEGAFDKAFYSKEDPIDFMRTDIGQHNYWKFGMGGYDSSVAWKSSRMYAATDERIRRWGLAIGIILTGKCSIRETGRLTNYHRNTAMKLFHRVVALKGVKIVCPCGKEIPKHQGWCSYRFAKSEARQKIVYSLLKTQTNSEYRSFNDFSDLIREKQKENVWLIYYQHKTGE